MQSATGFEKIFSDEQHNMFYGNTAQLQKRKKYGKIEIWTDK